MSDCLHCDIHEMLESHLQGEQADLAEIAARVTEVLADLILMVLTLWQTLEELSFKRMRILTQPIRPVQGIDG
jgi:hypothetical protein